MCASATWTTGSSSCTATGRSSKDAAWRTSCGRLVTDAALAKKQALAAELRAGVEALHARYGMFSDSTIGIRAERDAR